MVGTDLFKKMGGLEGIRTLVDSFYDLMDTDPDVKKIRDLHPDALSDSRDRLYMFLVGWSGGPPLYIEKFGHPRLRARHLPFPIGTEERDQWMRCMEGALKASSYSVEVQEFLHAKLLQIADFMRNENQTPAPGIAINRGLKVVTSDRQE